MVFFGPPLRPIALRNPNCVRTLVPSSSTAHGSGSPPPIFIAPICVAATNDVSSKACHRDRAALRAKTDRSSCVNCDILAFPERTRPSDFTSSICCNFSCIGASPASIIAQVLAKINTVPVFTLSSNSSIMVSMNRLDSKRRAAVVRCLVEGCSIRSTVRMTGVAKNTVSKLLLELGAACTKYMDDNMRDLSCERIQVDEIWQFVGCKQKNVTAKKIERDGICGDVWTWTAIDADTKLVPCFMIGQRDAMSAHDFMVDLAGRLAGRVQLTSDGLRFYRQAVKAAFGQDIDYAQLIKIYGEID